MVPDNNSGDSLDKDIHAAFGQFHNLKDSASHTHREEIIEVWV